MNKPAIRRQLRQHLAAIDDAHAHTTAQRVTARLLRLPEISRARGVLACLSFGHELRTWALVDALRANGIEVYVPRIVHRDRAMFLHRYPCPLETHRFGLQQPPASVDHLAPEAIEDTIDVALILGLAFDHEGFRLGYGGGYFDRFLARHPLFSIGLGHESQVVERLPRDAHDLPMDVVVTDACVRRTDQNKTNRHKQIQ